MNEDNKNQKDVNGQRPAANLSEDEGAGLSADFCNDKQPKGFRATLCFGPSKEEIEDGR